MMFRRALVLASLLISITGSPSHAQQRPTTAGRTLLPELQPAARTLRNGARIYALRDATSPNVSVHAYYMVGQRDDPRSRGGFAHLFEHLMFRTTRNLPDGVSGFVTSIGGQSNATTLFDYTSYYVQAPARQLESLIWLEGERLRNLVIDEASFAAERGVVKEEIRQRAFAAPYGRILYTLLPAFTFGDHPYARPIGGTLSDLDQATLSDVRAFHEAYYRSDNAIFVISGNFDPATLDAWVDRYLGSVPRPAAPIVRDARVAKQALSPRTIDSFAPNVPLPALIHAWRAPPAADPDAAGVALIDAMLVRGASGRLRRSLVDGSGVASNVTSYNLPARDGHAFALFVTLAEGRRIEEAEAALEAEIARLRDSLASEAELSAVKNAMLGDALRGRETPRGRAFELGDGAALAGDPLLQDSMMRKIFALTPEQVRAIARRRLDPARRIVIRYRNEAERPAGQGDVAGADVSMMGPVVPPASRAPVAIAGPAQREQPPRPSPEVARAVPRMAETTLANGMKVIVAQSSQVPLVTMRMTIDGGDASDPQELAGLSDLLTATALRGAGARDAAALAVAIDSLGASVNAGSEADAANLTVTAPLANIEPAGRLLADMVLRPTFPEAEIGRMRNQQSAALTVARRQPMATALRVLNVALFADSAYGRLPTAESLAAVDRPQILAAHRRQWLPGRSTLILTGAIDEAQGFGLAQRLFGDWTGGGGADPAKRAPASASGPQLIVVDMPGAAQAAVVAGLRAPPRIEVDYDALRVANARLGGGFLGFLNQAIRLQRGLSYGAGSQLDPRRDATMLLAASQTRNDAAQEVVGLILAQMQRLAEQPAGAAEAAERSAYVANALASQTERTEGLAGYLASLVATGAQLDAAREELGGKGSIGAEAMRAAAAALIRADSATVVVAGDSKSWIEPLRQRFPNLRRLTFDAVPAAEQEQ